MPRHLKRGILGASTIILSKDIDKYAFMCGSIFYETDVNIKRSELRVKVYLVNHSDQSRLDWKSVAASTGTAMVVMNITRH